MRFFQQIKFQFTSQQGLLRQTYFHGSGLTAQSNLQNPQSHLPPIGDVAYDNASVSSADHNLKETISRRVSEMFGKLFTKQRTIKMLILISIIVVLLHGLGLLWLRLLAEQATPARPVAMEVTIIPVSAPKPKIAAPPPPTPQPAAKIKPSPKKTQPKPTLKKRPVVQESADFAPKQQVFETQPVAQNTNVTATPDIAPPAKIEPFIEAAISADYEENPKPDYPSLAKSMGWQGKVMLRVLVSEEGLSAAVEIEHSSGYEILDESAVEAIKQWLFTPAKRGETPIAGSVIVPIIFTLQD